MPDVKRRYTFWIDDSLADALKTIKQRDGVPESEQLRRAIGAWVEARGVRVMSPPQKAPQLKKSTKGGS